MLEIPPAVTRALHTLHPVDNQAVPQPSLSVLVMQCFICQVSYYEVLYAKWIYYLVLYMPSVLLCSAICKVSLLSSALYMQSVLTM